MAEACCSTNMNYLIKGGEFNNKGAEAMTLVALYNIKKRDPSARIYILCEGPKCPFELINDPVFLKVSPYFLDVEFGDNSISTKKKILKDYIKLFVPTKINYVGKQNQTLKIINSIDVVIDISGFALSSKWGEAIADNYIKWIDLLKANGAKIYLMPQSFGPFHFDQELMRKIKSSLEKCDHIFAREEQGYQDLAEIGLTNVTKSLDSVLVDKEYDPSYVIRDFDSYREDYPVRSKHNVGIVPNARLFDRGNASREKLISLYSDIINCHINDNYSYFLISHAGEDLGICGEIKSKFLHHRNVVLFDHVLYSFNFEQFAGKLDYIVASRYHSIVHAYRSGTPCAIIGWSDKYDEIAKAFGQERYIINTDSLCLDNIIALDDNYKRESTRIMERLQTAQKSSCYSIILH